MKNIFIFFDGDMVSLIISITSILSPNLTYFINNLKKRKLLKVMFKSYLKKIKLKIIIF